MAVMPPAPAEDTERVPCRRIRCPKCRAAPHRLVELWRARITYEYDGRTRTASGDKDEHPPVGVRAVCACGHRWTLRRAIQITDLDAADAPATVGTGNGTRQS